MEKPKVIFLDMDGTILNHQNVVSEKTKEIINEIRILGIFVFIATGRSFEEIELVAPKGLHVDGYITSNGMAGYIGKKVIFEHSLTRKTVEEVIEKARENKIYYELFPYGHPRITLKQDKQYVIDEINDPKPDSVGINEWLSRKQAIKDEIEWTDQIVGERFSKFYFFARTKEHINHWKEQLHLLKQDVEFSTSTSSDHNVELMVANKNKATGIKEMLDYFHLPEDETMAIGDSNNDVQMLQFVSHAVAMKNAPDYLKELVDDVTDYTCDEDGVYHYLKTLFEL